MTLLPILLPAVYLGTGDCSSKVVHGSFFVDSGLDVREVKVKSIRELLRFFGMVRNSKKIDNIVVWPLSVKNEALLTYNFTL